MRLRSSTVHLLEDDLDSPTVPHDHLVAVLSPAERERGRRFRFPHLRRRHEVTWGRLRHLLGSVMGCDPAALGFVRNEHGKPFLRAGPSFNLSHSGNLLLLGLAEDGRLGVDIERVRRTNDLALVASRNFAEDEYRSLQSLGATEHAAAFFRIWTRKEALVKALGGGLSIPLRSFSVDHAKTDGNVLVRWDDPTEDLKQWEIRGVPMEEAGIEAAAAWDRTGFEIERIGWPPLGV